MKHPVVSPALEILGRAFGLDGMRVTWHDGRVFVHRDGKWRMG